MLQRVDDCAGLIGKRRVDHHEAGRLVEIIFDQIDAAGDRRPAERHPEEHDQQQAPPEDRHGIAEQRNRHQRLIEEAAALDRRDGAGGNSDANREQHREERQLQSCRKQRQELGQHLLLRGERDAEIAVNELPGIVEELFPDRLIQPQFTAEEGEPLGRHAMFADAHLHGIARH